ncbi:MAG: hypothetical protein J6S26_04235 [Solobacterium sp.]|nr:hypothetical protein [Solobacterium sp.]
MLETELRTEINEIQDPIELAVRKYRLDRNGILSARILHRSLDARAGRPACFLYRIGFELTDEASVSRRLKQKARIIQRYQYRIPDFGTAVLNSRPVIAGFGPCGMAAGLLLARCGYKPLILERGPKTEDRIKAVEAYWNTGVLDSRRNVQFGEGGAGAFSDGKLTTRVKDPRVSLILEELIKAGADPSIAWLNHPHIGTDRFREINVTIRKEIEALGGEVRFESAVSDLVIEHNALKAVITEQGEEIPCPALILAVGHSARDTFSMLNQRKLDLSSKQFAVGLRAEHLQSFIDARQYRAISDYSSLPPAEYHLSHTSSLGKGVYSFCMCPGGYVIAAASSPDTIVTNGMSYSARDGKNANAALVVQVDSSDFGDGLFDGMHFQEQLETKAFELGHGKAPAETIEHYLDPSAANEPSAVQPTYPAGVTMCDLHELFRDPLNQSLEEMLRHTESIFPGFTKDGALFTGVETRTSSPIRIVRDIHTLESNISGIFPSGEGAGYAGGIVSSAIDGIRCAEQIIARYQPF